jgi:hypothetical protein
MNYTADEDKNISKAIRYRYRKASRIDQLYYVDLSEQIKSLQKALANERGENCRFREEVLALLRQLF